MPDVVLAIALGWASVLVAGGGLVLLRARSALERLIALDLLTLLLVAVLALLSYLRDVSYYLDAGLGLALLSLVATLAVARYHGEGRLL